MIPLTLTLEFELIAARAGFQPGMDGKLNLPATQETADRLGAAAFALLPPWQPGDPACHVVLTGAGPVWGYLTIAHTLHGRAASLRYVAPNIPDGIVVFAHGG